MSKSLTSLDRDKIFENDKHHHRCFKADYTIVFFPFSKESSAILIPAKAPTVRIALPCVFCSSLCHMCYVCLCLVVGAAGCGPLTWLIPHLHPIIQSNLFSMKDQCHSFYLKDLPAKSCHPHRFFLPL